MAKSIIKELIIILLILLAIILALGVLFYDYIPTNKTVPSVGQYSTSEEVKAELEEKITEDDTVLVTYEITPSDLKKLEKTKDYEKGKVNPFSTYSENTIGTSDGQVGTNDENSVTNTNTTINTEKNNTKGTTFYGNGGTK